MKERDYENKRDTLGSTEDERAKVEWSTGYEQASQMFNLRLRELAALGFWPIHKSLPLSEEQAAEHIAFLALLSRETCGELGLPWPPATNAPRASRSSGPLPSERTDDEG
jgi:hypothetical protein